MLVITLVAILLGLAVGFARGGSLVRLAATQVRLAWLAGVAWALEALILLSPLAEPLAPYTAPLLALALVLVAVVVVANRREPGIALLGLGLLMNALVMAAHGGFMPVSDQAMRAAGAERELGVLRTAGRLQKSVLMQPDSPFWPLGDVLPMPLTGKVYSPGDLVAGLGVFVLIVRRMGTRAPSAAPANGLPASRGAVR